MCHTNNFPFFFVFGVRSSSSPPQRTAVNLGSEPCRRAVSPSHPKGVKKLKKAEWKETIKDLKRGDKVRVCLRGYPFPDYTRDGVLIKINEDCFWLKLSKDDFLVAERFSRSYQRVVSMRKTPPNLSQ